MSGGMYTMASEIESSGVNKTTYTLYPGAFTGSQFSYLYPLICNLGMTANPFWSATCLSTNLTDGSEITMDMIPNFDDPYQPMGDCYIEYLLANGVNKPSYYPMEHLLSMSCQWEGNVSDNYESFSYVFAEQPEMEPIEEPIEEPGEEPDDGL